jgi:hypothetical protein
MSDTIRLLQQIVADKRNADYQFWPVKGKEPRGVRAAEVLFYRRGDEWFAFGPMDKDYGPFNSMAAMIEQLTIIHEASK